MIENGICSAQKMIDIVLNDKGMDAKSVVVKISRDYIKEHFVDTDKPINMCCYSELSNDDLSEVKSDYPAEAKKILVYIVVPAENPPTMDQTADLLSNIHRGRELVAFGVDECCATETTEVYVFSV